MGKLENTCSAATYFFDCAPEFFFVMDTFSGRPKTPCLNYSLSHRTACEDNVKRTEDELKQCKARIKFLKDEATSIENSLKTTTERHISDRLVKAKSKLRIELNRETDLEESIKEQLDSAQLELEKAIIRQAKLSQIEDEIFTQEKELECFEEQYAQNTIHKLVKKRLVKAEEEKAIELESANKKEERFQARQKMQHLIVESAKRHKRIKDQSRAASEKINNQRMESIRELKEDIRLNRENLKALEAKNIANEIKLEQKEDEKLEWLVKSGMDYIQAENKLRADQNQKMREKK